MSKPAKSLLTAPLKSKVVPARSKLVVNKSVLSLSAKKANRETAKSGAVEKLDEIFAENLEMALALLPTVPFKHSTVVRKWISKLLQDPAVTKDKRNAHLSFLVFQMQNMKISDPFDKEPPQSLADGAKIFSGAKMQAMINEIDEKHLTDRFREGLTSHALSNFRSDFKPPLEFIDDQPMPVNGLLAYGGCFSNHFQ